MSAAPPAGYQPEEAVNLSVPADTEVSTEAIRTQLDKILTSPVFVHLTNVAGANRRPWWSPDGNLLYFLSTRDNYQCIWAQPLDPSTKRPRGDPIAVYHFHEARRALNILAGATFGPAMGGGRIVFALGEQTGNIWLAEPGG